MSFGFSVGDFIAVLTLAERVRKRFADSPAEFKAISDEVESLTNVLDQLADLSEDREISEQQKKRLTQCSGTCRNVLTELGKELDKYQELGQQPSSLRGKTKRLWKRVSFEPDSIKNFRARVASCVGLLSAFLDGLLGQDVQVIKKDLSRLKVHQNDQERTKVAEWLSSANYTVDHQDMLDARKEGSGRWLLESNQFKDWHQGTLQTLFCPGIPGAGKTIMSCNVIDRLLQHHASDATVGIAYIYFNFRRPEETKLNHLLGTLVEQLTRGMSQMPDAIVQSYRQHQMHGTRPSTKDYLGLLESMAVVLDRVFIVIDALDECTNDGNVRQRLLKAVMATRADQKVHLFATSRFIPEIVDTFKGKACIEIRAQDEDLEQYLKSDLVTLPDFVQDNNTLQAEMCSAIIKAIDGSFILARLYVRFIERATTVKSVRKLLKDILNQASKGSVALDTAYDKTVDIIRRQEAEPRELAMNVLAWITLSRRRMHVIELQHALAVEDSVDFDEENIPSIRRILMTCNGLVTVDDQSLVVRFIHYTTQEYMETHLSEWMPSATTMIIKQCLRYLFLDVFDMAPYGPRAFIPGNVLHEQYPFYSYAAEEWAEHARSSTAVKGPLGWRDLAMCLMMCPGKAEACMRYSQVEKLGVGFHLQNMLLSHRYKLAGTHHAGMHLAAHQGLVQCAQDLLPVLKNGDIDSRAPNGQSPLFLAAANGHEAMVRLLVNHDDVEADSRDMCGQTPLAAAARRGHEKVLAVLLNSDGVDVNAQDSELGTPLIHAVQSRSSAAVKILLGQENIDVNLRDILGRTAFWYAAGIYQDAAMSPLKILLDREGVDMDVADTGGITPLMLAVQNANEAAVHALLNHGDVDVNARDRYNQSSLSWAAERGMQTVVRALLNIEGIDVNTKNHTGRTPLNIAAVKGHAAVVEAFLQHEGVDKNLGDDEMGTTPLIAAARAGQEAVVGLLLSDEGVDPNKKQKLGRTALMRASAYKMEATVRQLLSHASVDVNAKDDEGLTALSWAILGVKDRVIIQALLGNEEIQVDVKDSCGRAPLSHASMEGVEAAVQLLLAHGDVDMNSRDDNGQTPLSLAAERGNEAVVRVLLGSEGVDVNLADHQGKTAIAMAAGWGYEAVVKLLLSYKSVGAKDKDGQTALSLAMEGGHEEVGKLLSDHERSGKDCED